jgi:hypothetical protein
MSTSHNGNDYERLKEELRRLKRRGAPWYFESALHQRLHGGRRRRPRLRPISVFPVLIVAFLTLCILGIAVYMVLVHTNLLLPRPHQTGPPAADTLSRALPVDSLLSPPRVSGPVKGSPRAVPRPVPQDRSPADTVPEQQPEGRPVTGDTAVARRDSAAVPRSDSSSHGVDTAVSGTGGRHSE